LKQHTHKTNVVKLSTETVTLVTICLIKLNGRNVAVAYTYEVRLDSIVTPNQKKYFCTWFLSYFGQYVKNRCPESRTTTSRSPGRKFLATPLSHSLWIVNQQ